MCCCLNSIYKKPLGKVKLWRQKVPQWLPGAGVGVKSSCQREGENFLRGWMCPQTGSRWSYCTDASKPGSSMLTWYLKCTAIKRHSPLRKGSVHHGPLARMIWPRACLFAPTPLPLLAWPSHTGLRMLLCHTRLLPS